MTNSNEERNERENAGSEPVVEEDRVGESGDEPLPKIRPTVEPGDKNEPEAGG